MNSKGIFCFVAIVFYLISNAQGQTQEVPLWQAPFGLKPPNPDYNDSDNNESYRYNPWEDGDDWNSDGWNDGSDWSGGSGFSDWGYVQSAEISATDESYFPRSVSESSSTLIDETTSNQLNQVSPPIFAYTPSGGGGSQNIFWIVSPDGTKTWHSVDMPQYRYARLRLIPSASGQLILEERYPNGQVRTYYFGNAMAHNQYRIWFYADTPGTHQMRYKINNGPYSDILTFHVADVVDAFSGAVSSRGSGVIGNGSGHNGKPGIQVRTQAVNAVTNKIYYSYNSEGMQIFQIKVSVCGPDKFNVSSVHYQLQPSFSQSEYTSTDPQNNFGLELWTWGEFTMPIIVIMKDGRIYEYNYYLSFEDLLRDAQSRGIPFVEMRFATEPPHSRECK